MLDTGRIQMQEALQKLMPDGVPQEAVVLENRKPLLAYYPVKTEDRLIGYILSLEGMGYGGEMSILAGYALDGGIRSVILMDNQETPGLGKKSEEPSYMTKFFGTGSDKPVPVRKKMLDTGEADAITGATITFIGIAKALAGGAEYVKNTLKE